jgi:predicted transcriptional regulator
VVSAFRRNVDIYEDIRILASMKRPTDSELAILRVLWERGPSTVRDVHHAMVDDRETGYTTTLKLMQIMAEKGLVTRDESSRTHIYSAKWSQTKMQRHLVSDLMERAFGGSASALVLQALSAGPTSDKELKEIQALIKNVKERAGRDD